MTVTKAFEYIKSPVEGRYPTKPDAYVSVYKAMQSGIIPAVDGAVFTYAMPSDPSKGYYYVDPAHCRAMTDGEKEEFAKICEERKRASSEKRALERAEKKIAKAKEEKQVLSEKKCVSKTDFENLVGKKIICFDTETTGIGKRDEILEIGIVTFDGDDVTPVFEGRFKPRNISSWPEAARVNGIYPKDVVNCPCFSEKLPEITKIFEEADIIVGYNVAFDVRMLEQSSDGKLTISKDKLFDPIDYFREKSPKVSHKLINACKTYVPELYDYFEDNAHGAMADADMTLRVLSRMADENSVSLLKESEKDR